MKNELFAKIAKLNTAKNSGLKVSYPIASIPRNIIHIVFLELFHDIMYISCSKYFWSCFVILCTYPVASISGAVS